MGFLRSQFEKQVIPVGLREQDSGQGQCLCRAYNLVGDWPIGHLLIQGIQDYVAALRRVKLAGIFQRRVIDNAGFSPFGDLS
jgi:hypothetical protein